MFYLVVDIFMVVWWETLLHVWVWWITAWFSTERNEKIQSTY